MLGETKNWRVALPAAVEGEMREIRAAAQKDAIAGPRVRVTCAAASVNHPSGSRVGSIVSCQSARVASPPGRPQTPARVGSAVVDDAIGSHPPARRPRLRAQRSDAQAGGTQKKEEPPHAYKLALRGGCGERDPGQKKT